MNKNTSRGLVILMVVIIVAVVLWRLYLAGPPTAGLAPAVISKPAVVASPAAPAPKEPGPQGLPAAPPIKPEAPQGSAPLQELSPLAPKITILPPPMMKEHYGILVGNYRNYQDAAKMLARLKKQGQPAFVQRDPRDLKGFQVWQGPFSSQDEARAAEKEMSARLKKPLKIEQIENPVPK
jgi:cell division septation protein DedD